MCACVSYWNSDIACALKSGLCERNRERERERKRSSVKKVVVKSRDKTRQRSRLVFEGGFDFATLQYKEFHLRKIRFREKATIMATVLSTNQKIGGVVVASGILFIGILFLVGGVVGWFRPDAEPLSEKQVSF